MSKEPVVWHVGGADVHRRIPLLQKLAKSGFHVGAVGSQDDEPFRRAGVEYRRYNLARQINPLSDAASLRQLTELFRAGRPDIVHAFDTKPAIYAMIASAQANVCGRVRTITGLGYLFSEDTYRTRTLRLVYNGLHKLAKKHVSWTIFQNPEDRDHFVAAGLTQSEQTSVVLGSGIDVAEVHASLAASPAALEVRKSLDLVGRKVALLPSRLIRQKGVLEFIDAARQLHRKDSSILFLLAGQIEGEGVDAVSQAEIASVGHAVRYIGNRSDILAIMNASDVVVLPSFYREGVPRALLEAAAIGVPIVTTDVPGCRETVIHDRSGWIVPPHDAPALAEAISSAFALGQPAREAVRLAALEHVQRNFELSLVAERYASIYRHVLSVRRN